MTFLATFSLKWKSFDASHKYRRKIYCVLHQWNAEGNKNTKYFSLAFSPVSSTHIFSFFFYFSRLLSTLLRILNVCMVYVLQCVYKVVSSKMHAIKSTQNGKNGKRTWHETGIEKGLDDANTNMTICGSHVHEKQWKNVCVCVACA